ncbi:MAG: hypothetical protein KatS3mg087_0015 [Patescibacteria group bacterium]|nr:MAG: hypothetical protein KatS3mg087_0015 [Patescibacteria group bacterium]
MRYSENRLLIDVPQQKKLWLPSLDLEDSLRGSFVYSYDGSYLVELTQDSLYAWRADKGLHYLGSFDKPYDLYELALFKYPLAYFLPFNNLHNAPYFYRVNVESGLLHGDIQQTVYFIPVNEERPRCKSLRFISPEYLLVTYPHNLTLYKIKEQGTLEEYFTHTYSKSAWRLFFGTYSRGVVMYFDDTYLVIECLAPGVTGSEALLIINHKESKLSAVSSLMWTYHFEKLLRVVYRNGVFRVYIQHSDEIASRKSTIRAYDFILTDNRGLPYCGYKFVPTKEDYENYILDDNGSYVLLNLLFNKDLPRASYMRPFSSPVNFSSMIVCGSTWDFCCSSEVIFG